ncbi:MAG: hypothetical protein WBX02_20855 [Terriglobales bacterium]
MDEATMRRREFLRTTTGVLTGLVIAGSPLALIAPGRAWAVDLTAFTSSEAATLMAVARTIAPHDKLDDAAYALVVHALDTDATNDGSTRKVFRESLDRLGTEFVKAAETDRVAALKKIESSEFFRSVRLKTLQVLYATPMAYAYFGYEGEAFSKGGYIERGFNNLRWLPEVPLADSGPVPGTEQRVADAKFRHGEYRSQRR